MNSNLNVKATQSTKVVQTTNYDFDVSGYSGYFISADYIVNSQYSKVVAQGTAVNATTDLVTSTSHGFALGQKVQVSSSGSLPTGLSSSTDYWIAYVDANSFGFSTSLANAQAGTLINITAVGSGNMTITNSLKFLSASEISTSTDKVTLYSHGLTTGEKVQVSTSSALPTGLAVTTDYFIIKYDADTFAFASSLVNANAGTAIDITAVGTGTQTITPTSLAGAGIKTQKSIDGSVWFDEEVSVSITTAASTSFGKSDVYYNYVRVILTLTAGNLSIALKLNGKSA